MAKWLQLPSEKLFHQADQAAFLAAHKARICKACRFEFTPVPPIVSCPKCGAVKEMGPSNLITRAYDYLTIIAGRRWGKSRMGSIAGVEEATFNNTIGWACAPTNPKLHRYVIPAFQQLIPNEWVQDYSSEFSDLRLKNGSLIHFQTLEDPDQGRGQGLDWLWIDEVCELTKKHWEVISPSLADRQGQAFFTTSPQSYDWVYNELYKPAEDGVSGYWACHGKSRDNPIMSEEYLARKKAQMSDSMFRQEFEADFVIFTGAVYGGAIDAQILRTESSIKQIIPEWPEIAPWRQVLVGLDTGADHPFGAVKLVSTEKGLVVVDEYLERHKSFLQHAVSIKTMCQGSTSFVKYAINRNERQPTIELAQHGIFAQAAENDVVSGTQRVLSWLQAGELWFIESKCPRTIREMKSYRWAENTSPKDDQKRTEKVYKVDDELPDCLRYALMTWPQLPKAAVADKNPVRDLSGLPEKIQQEIQMMRKVEGRIKEPVSITGDFWG